jgi:hypothetical protein
MYLFKLNKELNKLVFFLIHKALIDGRAKRAIIQYFLYVARYRSARMRVTHLTARP